MLVLSRRLKEKIVLPGLNVTIEVLAVKGNAVRLGITAPGGVSIVREELLGGPVYADAAPGQGELCHA
jgi:carbon storage regulator CsrA